MFIYHILYLDFIEINNFNGLYFSLTEIWIYHLYHVK